jgi:hypothetical protein
MQTCAKQRYNNSKDLCFFYMPNKFSLVWGPMGENVGPGPTPVCGASKVCKHAPNKDITTQGLMFFFIRPIKFYSCGVP